MQGKEHPQLGCPDGEAPSSAQADCGGESRVGCDHGDLEKPVDLSTDDEEWLQ